MTLIVAGNNFMAQNTSPAAPPSDRRHYHRPRSVEDLTKRNIETIAQLEAAAKQDRTRPEAIVDAVTYFFGRMSVVYIHFAWFGIWIVLNTLMPKKEHFDPFPFPFLTSAVSLEAIFLSIFILISQNRQSRVDERRNHLELQINLLSEQENTKMLWLLERIAGHVGVDISDDPDVKILGEATEPERMLEQIDQTLEEAEKQAKEKGKKKPEHAT